MMSTSRFATTLLLLGLALPGPSAGPARADVTPPGARSFGIARLKYGGGGDWYEDRTSLSNLMRFVRDRTAIPLAGDKEAIVEPGSASIFQYPFVFACGHGNIKLTPDEVGNLGAFLMGPDSAFITGSDVLMDGGVTASYFYGELAPQ